MNFMTRNDKKHTTWFIIDEDKSQTDTCLKHIEWVSLWLVTLDCIQSNQGNAKRLTVLSRIYSFAGISFHTVNTIKEFLEIFTKVLERSAPWP